MLKWFKMLSPTMKIVIVIIAVIVVIVISRKIREFLNTPKTAKVNWNNIPRVGNDTDGNPVIWNPDPLAKEIYENLEGWNLRVYPETAQKILDLQTDDQVRLLYNHYNKNYAKDKPTLTQLIDSEFPDRKGIYKKAVARLKGLGLN